MILCDSAVGSKELVPLIRGLGVKCDKTHLDFGDASFEGNGPKGIILLGVERKTLHDMLACIDDSRYTGHQRIGMKETYAHSFLMVEGYWKPREDGFLMESRDGRSWWVCRPHGKPVLYSKLFRYLISISISGVSVNFTQNIWHTAFNICEIFHWSQKKWQDHTSLLEIHRLAIPQLNFKPTLTRKWATDIDGIGVKMGGDAERLFKKPINLATADEQQWMQIQGVGPKTARDIVRQIRGNR